MSMIGEKDVENVTDPAGYPDQDHLLGEGVSARQALTEIKVLLALPADTTHRQVVRAVQDAVQPQVMTVEEVVRQRTARQEALHTVMDLWQQHQLSEDPPAMDDLVTAAEWLATGDTSAVERLRRLVMEQSRSRSGDAASWAPGQ